VAARVAHNHKVGGSSPPPATKHKQFKEAIRPLFVIITVMNALQIYDHFGTPPNLRIHMLTVAGLVRELQSHWNGPGLPWEDVIKAALLHDVGNVVKFDLDNFPELLGSEIDRKEYWHGQQQKLLAKYGADDHAATDRMLDELGIAEVIRSVIQKKSFGNAKEIAASDDWLPKILLYCDLRVLPGRVGTLTERVDEFKRRLKKYSEREDFPELVDACRKIEGNITLQLTNSPDAFINDVNAAKHRDSLLSYNVSR
jgi:hypothetical protein